MNDDAATTNAPGRWRSTVALVVVALADVAWLLWPWVYAVSITRKVGGEIGSVGVGIGEGLIATALLPVPLALHRLAQAIARRHGANVQQLWRLHVRAFLFCLVVAVIAAMASYVATPLLPILLAALVCVGLVLVGQHVVIAVVIWRGLRAVRDWKGAAG